MEGGGRWEGDFVGGERFCKIEGVVLVASL